MIKFGILSDVSENVKRLSLNDALRFSISQDEIGDLIIELNTEGQLFDKGIDGEGMSLDSIGGSYSDLTEASKRRKGQPFAHVTLKDTGDFYDSFMVHADKESFTISADTLKEGTDLLDRWGDDIIGLTDESLGLLVEELIPLIQGYIINTLFRR